VTDEQDHKCRVDKWLWAARFYKTRSIAADAVDTGKVTVNGGRVKPARTLKLGDNLTIRTPSAEYVVLVTTLSVRRGSATEAATLYSETEESKRQREYARLTRSERHPDARSGIRPTKRARRQLHRFRGEPG